MDQELIAYLDARFTQIDARFTQTSQEIREVKETVGKLEGTVGQLDGRIGKLEGTVGKLDGKVEKLEGTVGHLQITVESMRDDIRQVAEGVIANNERIDAFKGEMVLDLGEILGLLRPMYMKLDTRISSLESWRERTERDPLEIIRERYGKPKS
jgi:chromosome segregation ATPase